MPDTHHKNLNIMGDATLKNCSCGAPILWLETESAKQMPVNPQPEKRLVRFNRNGKVFAKIVDTFVPHWATCPDAEKFRKRGVERGKEGTS